MVRCILFLKEERVAELHFQSSLSKCFEAFNDLSRWKAILLFSKRTKLVIFDQLIDKHFIINQMVRCILFLREERVAELHFQSSHRNVLKHLNAFISMVSYIAFFKENSNLEFLILSRGKYFSLRRNFGI